MELSLHRLNTAHNQGAGGGTMCHMKLNEAITIALNLKSSTKVELQEAHRSLDSASNEASAGIIRKITRVTPAIQVGSLEKNGGEISNVENPPLVDLRRIKKLRLKIADELHSREIPHKLPRPARRIITERTVGVVYEHQ